MKMNRFTICTIEGIRIESTPYLPSTNSLNTFKAIADALPISANNTRLRLENYMDEKYDQAALNHLNKQTIKQQFFNEKDKAKSLKEQIDILKSGI